MLSGFLVRVSWYLDENEVVRCHADRCFRDTATEVCWELAVEPKKKKGLDPLGLVYA